MYNEKIEALIKAALADGELTEKEKQILFRQAQAEGIDLDEFEMVLDARLVELQKEQRTSAPKSNKFGDVKKCPICGAIVSAGLATCKECGYAFMSVESTSSIKLLYEELKKADNTSYEKGSSLLDSLNGGLLEELKITTKKAQAKATIIRNFPVPNAKQDLLEFLSGIHMQANPKGRKDNMSSRNIDATEDLGLAYWQLYSKCISMAKISFSKDPAFLFFFEHYEEVLWKSKNILVRLFSKRK